MDTPEHTPELFTPEEREQAVMDFVDKWSVAAVLARNYPAQCRTLRRAGWEYDDFQSFGAMIACKVAVIYDRSRGVLFSTVVLAAIRNHVSNLVRKCRQSDREISVTDFIADPDLHSNLWGQPPKLSALTEAKHIEEQVAKYLSILSPRQRKIVVTYHGIGGVKKKSLPKIAKGMGVCGERARQLYQLALAEIRREIDYENKHP